MDVVLGFCKRQTAFGNGLHTRDSPYRLERIFDEWNRQQSLFALDKGEKFLQYNCVRDITAVRSLNPVWNCEDDIGFFQVIQGTYPK